MLGQAGRRTLEDSVRHHCRWVTSFCEILPYSGEAVLPVGDGGNSAANPGVQLLAQYVHHGRAEAWFSQRGVEEARRVAATSRRTLSSSARASVASGAEPAIR